MAANGTVIVLAWATLIILWGISPVGAPLTRGRGDRWGCGGCEPCGHRLGRSILSVLLVCSQLGVVRDRPRSFVSLPTVSSRGRRGGR